MFLPFKSKKKINKAVDYFIKEKKKVDYRDIEVLKKFVNKQGRINHRNYTKLTAKNQRLVSKAIKTARQMALMEYIISQQN